MAETALGVAQGVQNFYELSVSQTASLLAIAFFIALYAGIELENRWLSEKTSKKPEDLESSNDLENNSAESLGNASIYSTYLLPNAAHFRDLAELSLILLYFFLCDRYHLFNIGPKTTSNDAFWFIWLILLAIAYFTVKSSSNPSSGTVVKPSPPLQRNQTDEWKGWMQIMFLLYHYFNTASIYNLIRVFIAAYVWMTGFGNFSYYYSRGDFSMHRFGQMLWRLNFFAVICCWLLNNEYMLYYICPLHTFCSVAIWVVMRVGHQKNSDAKWIRLKLFVICAAIVCLWNIPGVFDMFFAPFSFIFGFSVNADPSHEWRFRSKLDHLVWVFGMIFAYFFPTLSNWLAAIENSTKKSAIRTSLGCGVGAVLAIWYYYVGSLEKLEYNLWHPYTSIIPILCFIILRNIHPKLREYYSPLFSWFGQFTLESYISQFHIWMITTGNNGSPKILLVLIPDYPLVNFWVVSAIFIFISYRLFHLSNAIKEWMIPSPVSNQPGNQTPATQTPLKYRFTILIVGVSSFYVLGFLIHQTSTVGFRV